MISGLGRLFCGTLLASAALSASAFACELKIGSPAVLSGPAAQWGMALRGALEFVAKETVEEKRLVVNGETCTVSVVAIDSKYTAEGAASAMNSLAAEGIKVIVGAVGSPEVTGMKPIATRNRMVAMVNSFAKDAIGPQWPNVFHIGPGPSGWAGPIIDKGLELYKFDTVSIVAPNDQGGTDIAGVNAEIFKQKGVTPTEEYYQRGTTNFAPIVTRMLAAKPGAVDLASSPAGDAGIIVKQLRQAGFTGPIFRLGGPGTEEIGRVAGGYNVLQDFLWFEPIAMDDNTKALEEKHIALMGKPRPENADFFRWVYAARMMVKAAQAAQSVDDAQKIADAMRTLPVDDENIGAGHWIGQKFFGINQEMSYPFAIGVIQAGEQQPYVRAEAANEG
ncbi:ABC transporter substrate-binding protein [Paracoccus sulfuroxidans]|uniref:Amino acid/amide ABC transporter substrate-binding protein, HAAT family (TC 3.A.1.4.-) n=1 Tax=Paracoccus sulfuroxidans TaxID=384678 RepID=A0A562NGT2_9RHOB|nr:ABC transporter substrate-binding protein [Paracoccus sulfuroxidans]TWI31298.1 amino acid/amide ABC transporter substrate-binding protein, HAAT family (TC 3.A.1.4.-) [Paracoccus sulfuroxidans]